MIFIYIIITVIFEYLIKTYTNPGELVLDNCMGSGTTAIACINTNRNFIGFEMNAEYYGIARNRIKEHKKTIDNQRGSARSTLDFLQLVLTIANELPM